MPLDKSGGKGAFKRNVSTLMDEVGKSSHVGSPSQALAIAYDIKRRGKASGGAAATPRSLYKSSTHAGPINSVVPGRTDNHAMDVAPGSYVVPSETVSHLGENNTSAGMSVLGQMFGKSGPYGMGKTPSIKRGAGVPKPPGMKKMRADGGEVSDDAPVPIMAAGGEFVIPPEIVAEIGGGDVDRGHKVLDKWIMGLRQDHIRTLKKLPPPAKS